jgi:hypothetical protein
MGQIEDQVEQGIDMGQEALGLVVGGKLVGLALEQISDRPMRTTLFRAVVGLGIAGLCINRALERSRTNGPT